MIDRHDPGSERSLKGYDTTDFVADLRQRRRDAARRAKSGGLIRRTHDPARELQEASSLKRKLVEEAFGWGKTVAGSGQGESAWPAARALRLHVGDGRLQSDPHAEAADGSLRRAGARRLPSNPATTLRQARQRIRFRSSAKFNGLLGRIAGVAGGRGVVVLVEGGIGVHVAQHQLGMRDVQTAMELRAGRALHAMVRPQHLRAVGEGDRLVGLPAGIGGGERAMAAGCTASGPRGATRGPRHRPAAPQGCRPGRSRSARRPPAKTSVSAISVHASFQVKGSDPSPDRPAFTREV